MVEGAAVAAAVWDPAEDEPGVAGVSQEGAAAVEGAEGGGRGVGSGEVQVGLLAARWAVRQLRGAR